MHLTSIATLALLPLAAIAQTTTATSTVTMTNYITISQVSTSSVFTSFSANSTLPFLPTGTGVGTTSYLTSLPPTSTPAGGASPTGAPGASATVPPPNAGSALNAARVAYAGIAGMALAAMM